MTWLEIQQMFLDFFRERGHTIVASSSLVPRSDPTLLFTNAGMVQFKDVFLGSEKKPYVRAATAQKCLRVSGKHNDLDEIGPSPRHHTFFTMLGNFSFGDYFKEEAIQFAWELLLDYYRLPLERLWFTVYENDDEAFELWKKVGAAPERILRFGEKENFWAMGETGPCGPCSEIHYFQGDDLSQNRAELVNGPGHETIEIWNLVFMQFNRDETGQMTPLPKPSVDTGMGLERLTAVLQGKRSNYETDLIRPIVEFIASLAHKDYLASSDDGVSMRVIADHARATAFLIADGVFPGNESRAYVLRKIMRRALWHGSKLGIESPFFYKVAIFVADLMGQAFPEVLDARSTIERVVTHEEKLFSSTIAGGLRKLDEVMARTAGQVIAGKDAFMLYDTFGLREDLIQYIADQRGYAVDWEGFKQEMEQQRQRAQAGWKASLADKQGAVEATSQQEIVSEFLGYDTLEAEATVTHIFVNGQKVEEATEGMQADVVLDRTPFYAEAGGQIGDTGVIEGEHLRALVTDCISKTFTEQGTALHVKHVHQLVVERGYIRVGDSVRAIVDAERRSRIRPHHTATHLVHAALRAVLGPHVKQAGSLVAPDRLRFDFTHFAPLTPDEIEEIEALVNQQILRNADVRTDVLPLDEALNAGAIAFFGEKYGTHVRVLTVPGFSVELCGGTHVSRTGDIGVFKIIKEESIGAGLRRIEAVTGKAALERFQEDEERLAQLAAMLNTSAQEVVPMVERLQAELKATQRELEQLKLKLARQSVGQIASRVRQVNGVRVLAERIEGLDAAGARELADQLLSKLESGVVVLGRVEDQKVSLVVRVSKDLVGRLHAGQIVKELARQVGGGGGGRADLAEAGGRSPEKLDDALNASVEVIERLLNS
ncbi:MAG: alanine--tRNA ligase [Acidobacteriota bacterium]|nr:alanine--tRNA ligase [Blastocatellia bacterium]MDW8240985.1 alanine--tRNA ligase [Acidobacteriota bacterium]